MAAPATKLTRLLGIRTRLIEDLEHHFEKALEFNNDSNATLISYRTTMLEKALQDFLHTNESLEEITAYHALESVAEIKRKNRDVQDQYLVAKIHIGTLVDNEQDRTLNSTFFQPTRDLHRDENARVDLGQRSTGIKLEKIQIAHFDGKYEKWPEFKAMFVAIMSKFHGDDIEKLTHLKNVLDGDAKDIVRHIDNYDTAWQLLVAQYENKHAIINAHLRSFHEIQYIANAVTIRQAITITNGCLAGIKNLGIMVETWDPFIVYVLSEKFSPELRQKWEEERKGSYEPTPLKQLLTFLETRHKISASLPPRKVIPKPAFNDFRGRAQKTFTTVTDPMVNSTLKGDDMRDEATYEEEETSLSVYDDATDGNETVLHNRFERRPVRCLVCNEGHRTYQCEKMKPPSEALRIAKEKNMCLNCLFDSHETSQCISRFTCNVCQKKHHTILHEAFITMDLAKRNEKIFHTTLRPVKTLLVTAIVPIYTTQGVIALRALVDQGSTANLISERGAQLIRCARQRIIPMPMLGLDNVVTSTAHQKTAFMIGSLYDRDYKLSMDAYITSSITAAEPITKESFKNWPHLQNLQLADPTHDEWQVDMLIGNRTLAEIIEHGLVKGTKNQPIAQKTALGWILSGASELTDLSQPNQIEREEQIHINMITNETLTEQLKTFWELEEVQPRSKNWSTEEQSCYDFFMKNVTRSDDGKLVMRIPFKDDPNSLDFLGDSLKQAEKRFVHLERRFEKKPKLKEEYTKCINEYISLGHAVKVPFSQYCHIIPHHAVLKESSLTTKLRVVFDASAKTTNGHSLNDRMHIGPKILEELWAVLLRWRLGEYAVSSDIEKMYRQFLVHPDDAKFQQILWRNEQSGELELYELRTVSVQQPLHSWQYKAY